MANVAQRFCGTAVNQAGAVAAPWLQPGSVTRNDGDTAGGGLPGNDVSRAAYADVAGGESQYLLCTNFRFDQLYDPIPADATIKGVQVRVAGGALNGSTSAAYAEVRLVKGGVISGSDRGADVPLMPTNLDIQAEDLLGQQNAEGWTDDLWGNTLTGADVRASTFGVAIRVKGPAGVRVGVDSVQVRVYWEKPLAAVLTHSGASGTAPFVFFADALRSCAGAAPYEKCEARWTVTGPGGWSQTAVDRRPGQNVFGTVRDCATEMVGYQAAWLFDVAGTYTVQLTWVSPTGATATTSVGVTVAADTGRAKRYVSATGSNGNNGLTAGAPWATLAYAIQNAPAGSYIYLKDDQIHQLPTTVFGLASPVRDLVIARQGGGAAKPTIDCPGTAEFNNVDRLLVMGVHVTGDAPWAFYSPTDGSRPCRVVAWADCTYGALTAWFQEGELGVGEYLFMLRCSGGPTYRYVILPGSWRGVVTVGCDHVMSDTNNAEACYRYNGPRSSNPLTMGGTAAWHYWCRGTTPTLQGMFRGITSYGGIFQCAAMGNARSIVRVTDDGTPEVFGAYVFRIDGLYAGNGIDVKANHCHVVNSVGASPGPDANGRIIARGVGEQMTFSNCLAINSVAESGGVMRATEVRRYREKQLVVENCVFIADAPLVNWESLYREQKEGSGDQFTVFRAIRASTRNCWPAESGARFYLYDGGNQAYTFAQWAQRPWVTQDIQEALRATDTPPGRDFAVPPASRSYTQGTPADGVHRDYRGVARNRAAASWPLGATGSEPMAPTGPAPPTMTAPTPGAGQITWHWTSTGTVEEFRLYAGTSATGPWNLLPVPLGPSDTSVTTTHDPGAAVFAYLTAVNGAAESAPSNVVSATPTPALGGGGFLTLSGE